MSTDLPDPDSCEQLSADITNKRAMPERARFFIIGVEDQSIITSQLCQSIFVLSSPYWLITRTAMRWASDLILIGCER